MSDPEDGVDDALFAEPSIDKHLVRCTYIEFALPVCVRKVVLFQGIAKFISEDTMALPDRGAGHLVRQQVLHTRRKVLHFLLCKVGDGNFAADPAQVMDGPDHGAIRGELNAAVRQADLASGRCALEFSLVVSFYLRPSIINSTS